MSESIKTILGRNIKALRQKKGLSQSQLAEMVDVSFRYISYVECGKSFPSAEVLESLSQALDIPIQMLFCKEILCADSVSTELKTALIEALDEFQRTAEKLRTRIEAI